MTHTRLARRSGLCALTLAASLRLLSPENPTETGQAVRFLPSFTAFSPQFVESPPAQAPAPAPLPSYAGEDIRLYYGAAVDPDIPGLLAQPLTWDLRGTEPRVLILHTHTTESYAGTQSWRSLDQAENMLSIGAYLAELLQQAGIPTLQDRTLHDHPAYNGAYVRSRAAVSALLAEHPTVLLVLDLHRDASGSGPQLRTLAQVEGQSAAQLMLVLGTNHSGYRENLSLALKLQAQLERQDPGITRPLQLRAQRFNQDLSPGALLVEVGAAGNSQAEALLAVRSLARAIIALAGGTG